MALHGGGHLELEKMHKGGFGASSEFVWGDVHVSFLKKISFLQFYSRFNPNALVLKTSWIRQCKFEKKTLIFSRGLVWGMYGGAVGLLWAVSNLFKRNVH